LQLFDFSKCKTDSWVLSFCLVRFKINVFVKLNVQTHTHLETKVMCYKGAICLCFLGVLFLALRYELVSWKCVGSCCYFTLLLLVWNLRTPPLTALDGFRLVDLFFWNGIFVALASEWRQIRVAATDRVETLTREEEFLEARKLLVTDNLNSTINSSI
jgi:hypothetical protein